MPETSTSIIVADLTLDPEQRMPNDPGTEYVQVPVRDRDRTVCSLDRVDDRGPWSVNCCETDPDLEFAALHEQDLCAGSASDALGVLRSLLQGNEPEPCSVFCNCGRA